MSEFVEAVLGCVRRYQMLEPGDTVVIAVSGGPDSVAMLHAIWALRTVLDIKLLGAHMEHGLRGAESEQDARFVSQLCAQLEIPCVTEHRSIAEVAGLRHVSIQVAARDERHEFLRSVAHDHCVAGRPRISLGHTADDRAETVLVNIVRGCGIRGLCAMPAVEMPLIRPLIQRTRAEVEAYCAEIDIEPRIDASNIDLKYTRNRVRTELLPLLEAYYNSGVRNSLTRLAEICEGDLKVLEAAAGNLFRSALVFEDDTEIRLRIADLREAPEALVRRAIIHAIRRVRRDTQDVGFELVERVVQQVLRKASLELTLPASMVGSMHVRAGSHELRFWVQQPALDSWRTVLPVPGEVTLAMAGMKVSAKIAKAAALSDDELSVSARQSQHQGPYVFRMQDVGDVLLLRSWRPGDTLRPRGLSGTKKLQDLYTDCRMPRARRSAAPLLASQPDAGPVLAVLGIRAGDRSLDKAEVAQIAQSEPDLALVVISISGGVNATSDPAAVCDKQTSDPDA